MSQRVDQPGNSGSLLLISATGNETGPDCNKCMPEACPVLSSNRVALHRAVALQDDDVERRLAIETRNGFKSCSAHVLTEGQLRIEMLAIQSLWIGEGRNLITRRLRNDVTDSDGRQCRGMGCAVSSVIDEDLILRVFATRRGFKYKTLDSKCMRSLIIQSIFYCFCPCWYRADGGDWAWIVTKSSVKTACQKSPEH